MRQTIPAVSSHFPFSVVRCSFFITFSPPPVAYAPSSRWNKRRRGRARSRAGLERVWPGRTASVYNLACETHAREVFTLCTRIAQFFDGGLEQTSKYADTPFRIAHGESAASQLALGQPFPAIPLGVLYRRSIHKCLLPIRPGSPPHGKRLLQFPQCRMADLRAQLSSPSTDGFWSAHRQHEPVLSRRERAIAEPSDNRRQRNRDLQIRCVPDLLRNYRLRGR